MSRVFGLLSIVLPEKLVQCEPSAGLAQLVVHLICNQGVGGSNPSAGTIFPIGHPRACVMDSRVLRVAIRGLQRGCAFIVFRAHCSLWLWSERRDS